MRGYITAQEAAKRLGFEYTYFTRLLNEGRVSGAEKWQGVWLVPEDADVERLPTGPKKISK